MGKFKIKLNIKIRTQNKTHYLLQNYNAKYAIHSKFKCAIYENKSSMFYKPCVLNPDSKFNTFWEAPKFGDSQQVKREKGTA